MNPPSGACTRCQSALPGGAAFCPTCGYATPAGFATPRPDTGEASEDTLERLRTRLADRYTIERELGRGGMAVVYLAQDTRHNRRVAVKVLLPEIAILLGPERFLREIEITAQLQHPNIVPVHDSGNVDGTLYYVMPFIEGESLRGRLARDNQLPLDDVLQIVREAGDALDYAHERGIVHRDIKPENILLSAGHAQVADFGIARALRAAGAETLTRTGAIVGTPAYMAPEQAAGLPDVDGRADVYALAAVAHEALVGNRADPLAAARTSENLLAQARPDVPPPLARALSAPLALERELRPGTVGEWLQMIDRTGRRSRSPGWRWAALAAVAALAIVGGWWIRGMEVGAPVEDDLRRIALQLDVSDTEVLPPQALHDAFAQQLLYLPGAEFVADTTSASEVLRARADLEGDNRVRLTTQLFDRSSRDVIEQVTEVGALSDIPQIVKTVLTRVYSRQIAEQELGWSGALPRRTETWLDQIRGEQLLRSGNYADAIRRFERVIEIEPSYAPAHFKRMLAELLRARPTRAFDEVTAALAAARTYGDSLDPVTRGLLRGYDTLIRTGDLAGALGIFQGIVDRSPDAIDAHFVLGFLKVNFAGLLGEPPTAARPHLREAYEIDSAFAAVLAQLARIAYLQDNTTEAQRYTQEYLELDSTSATAEVLRLGDSASVGSGPERARLLLSLESRPLAVLEYVALLAGAVDQTYQDRLGSRTAIEVLEDRAVTPMDRRIAFRMRMALLYGTGQLASVDSTLDAARGGGVPINEIDAWLVLPALATGDTVRSATELDAAATRLAAHTDDPTSLWLAARWFATRQPVAYRTAVDRLEALVASTPDTAPLARGLLLDIQAHATLARGDTTGALERWRAATQRYGIGDVMFGLVGSFWPLQLDLARVAAALGHYPDVHAAARHFRYMAGFVDQLAWHVIWPLDAAAYVAAGDPLGAREIANLLEPVLRDANGKGIAVRDSLQALAGTR
jgi:serine/threonine protein kinase/Flp pilus assembly protein TadD